MSMFRRYFGWALSAMLFAVGSINAQDAWPTIFHDAQRTSASRDGYIVPPLSHVWSYTPVPKTGYEFEARNFVTNVVATSQAVYQHYYVVPVGQHWNFTGTGSFSTTTVRAGETKCNN